MGPRIESYRELQLDLGDGVSSGRMGHEWSIIRPNQETGQGVQSSNPIRLSMTIGMQITGRLLDRSADHDPVGQRTSASLFEFPILLCIFLGQVTLLHWVLISCSIALYRRSSF